MSLWSQIKYAMNSTLGMANFKPLDQIIEGQRSLAASDSVISVLRTGPIMITGSANEVVARFGVKKSGSLRLMFEAAASASVGCSVVIENSNKETIASLSVSGNSSMSAYQVDFPVDAAEEYTLLVKQPSSGHGVVNLRYIKLGANVVDTSLVEKL